MNFVVSFLLTFFWLLSGPCRVFCLILESWNAIRVHALGSVG